MAIVGMIGGIIIARYVVGVDNYAGTFPYAMVGWFAGLLLGSGLSAQNHDSPGNAGGSPVSTEQE